MKITCCSCGKCNIINRVPESISCSCGAKLLPQHVKLLNDIYWRITELNAEIDKHSSGGLCEKFIIEF